MGVAGAPPSELGETARSGVAEVRRAESVWAVREGAGREGGAGVTVMLGEGEEAGRQPAKGRETALHASSASAMTAASAKPYLPRRAGIS